MPRKLEYLAMDLCEDCDWDGPNRPVKSLTFTPDQLEKLVNQVIKECIEQGKQVQSQDVSNGSKDYVLGRKMGIEVFINQIKKHFGVEE